MHSTVQRQPEKDLLRCLRQPKLNFGSVKTSAAFKLQQRSNFGSIGTIAKVLKFECSNFGSIGTIAIVLKLESVGVP